MADPVVSFLIERLGDALIRRVIGYQRIPEQFESLRSEFMYISEFLQNADARLTENPSIRTWVNEVRNIAGDVEDLVDEFLRLVASQEKRRSGNIIKRYTQKFAEVRNLDIIRQEIGDMLTKVKEISERRKRYDLGGGASSSKPDDDRRSFPHYKDEDIIGLEDGTTTLVAELMKEEERFRVVSICGMAGSGKTTLAKHVYNLKEIKSHFDRCAWGFISQQCRTRDVLQEILRSVSDLTRKEMKNMNEAELFPKLYAILQEMRYLVVLDDIWSTEDWEKLKYAFPNGKKGSKVMLTTRNIEVAKHADPRSLHFEPRALSDAEAWGLLCKKAYLNDVNGDHEKCGREMVKKCGGLPLAVVVLGGILATKESLNQWEAVSKDIVMYMSEGQSGVRSILGLSYDGLPSQFKPLFLYFGLFPEDYQIPVKILVRMWFAEGMLRQKNGRQVTSEDVREKYINGLIQRCMVQVGERDLMGRVKTCQLHDMMRDVCITKGREESFFEIFNVSSEGSSAMTTGNQVRRCAVYLEDERYVLPQFLTRRLRSIIFFQTSYYSNVKFVYRDLKRLRVLELQGIRLNTKVFGKVIGKFVNLRYLGLRDTGLTKIPKSIGNLVFMQSLDLRCGRFKLPNVIGKMKHLRYFYMDGWAKGSQRLRLDTLNKLQVLIGIESGPWVAHLMKFTDLQKLGITDLTGSRAQEVINSIVHGLDNLGSLRLGMDSFKLHSFPELEGLSRKHHLLKLELKGRIDRLPSQWPPNLIKLKLTNSELEQDPMPILENLQNLMWLGLSFDSYRGKRMLCSGNGFPQLQYLSIAYVFNLEEWVVEEGAMPHLTTCQIYRCNMKMIPQGFRSITTIQKLQLLGMPARFNESVREGGEDWYIVQHIPSIIVKEKLWPWD